MSINDADLRPYGFRPGCGEAWCATCGRTVEGLDPSAFKCRPCAVEQFRLVEKQINTCGDQMPTNPVPPDYQELQLFAEWLGRGANPREAYAQRR